MKHMAQIGLFLTQVKAIIELRNPILVEREASMAFLSARGMTIDDLKAIILTLTTQDCVDGPEPDRNPKYAEKWTVAEFGPVFNDEKLYLKISVHMNAQQCKCLSVKLWTERAVER